MSLGVQDGNSTQALVEDVVMGAYQARWARVSALVMLLWDHGNYWFYVLLALYLAHPFLQLLVWIVRWNWYGYAPSFHITNISN